MSKVSTFKWGGVHPDDKKNLSKNSPIEPLVQPEEIIISMAQHLGAPAEMLKKKGDRVERGELIAKASSFISANVHSPLSGVVKDIVSIVLPSGANAPALVISVDAEQKEVVYTKKDYSSLSCEQIIEKAREMGIVGLGGATFPSDVKFRIPTGKKVEALIINAVECEPYLTSDYRTMIERTDEVLEGIEILKKAVAAEKTFIAIELNKKDAIEKFEAEVKKRGLDIEVESLKMRYPQGDEKQLINAVTGKMVPSGKLPIDVGAVVSNVSTVFALYEAVALDKPLYERVVTVSGEGVKEAKNILAPIGAKACDLFAQAGGLCDTVSRLISGGPMMGFAFFDENTPVTKGSGGLLAIPVSEDESTFNCVSCGRCVMHCPMHLMPNKMFRNIKYGNYQAALDLGLMDCKECGCCAYSCPSHIPLVQGFKLGKKMGRKKK
ncbi:MAG TPA: electron transport complex subunit RsxC [Candidatus Ornithospirochaeta avicola]|uniref:Ion-translocating oxidoreductase complex subunit C n=1 Tax=Candidatus Ornithospirochaeta avicola TaxID=2840896 RepID=A0A9D1PVP5_9SPIO|nr:electron transport complex subunit RsxC [Candidatus Ornithospirochaeta avicola]